MAREKWLIDPAELDEFQREIRSLSLNDSYIIKGCAGSGKTILALYRANDTRILALAEDPESAPSFTVLVYTKTLRAFIASGIRDLGINLRQVIHYAKWDGSSVDYIIADEIQDFTKEEIDELFAAGNKSVMFYGDTQQQLYSNRSSIEESALNLNLPVKELLKNYRLPKSLAAFASHVGDDKFLDSKCVKDGAEKPRLKRFPTWQDQLDYIINEIKTRNLTDVGILLPFNVKKTVEFRNEHRNVETVREYFDSKGFACQYKFREDDKDIMELDFDSELPKVMPFHSSKGLQFEAVFIPFCDYPQHDEWFISHYRIPLYVALTRSYKSLYLTYSNTPTPFFNGIPSSKYE